jgi:hypothetical protein
MKFNKKWAGVILGCMIVIGVMSTETALKNHSKKGNGDQVIIQSNTTTSTPAKEPNPSPKSSPTTDNPKAQTEGSNIDAVNYESVDATKEGSTIKVHVIVGDTNTGDVSKFVIPYSKFVEDYNKGTFAVTLELYKSKDNFIAKKPSWEFKGGILSEL